MVHLGIIEGKPGAILFQFFFIRFKSIYLFLCGWSIRFIQLLQMFSFQKRWICSFFYLFFYNQIRQFWPYWIQILGYFSIREHRLWFCSIERRKNNSTKTFCPLTVEYIIFFFYIFFIFRYYKTWRERKIGQSKVFFFSLPF